MVPMYEDGGGRKATPSCIMSELRYQPYPTGYAPLYTSITSTVVTFVIKKASLYIVHSWLIEGRIFHNSVVCKKKA
jgi:hypothetical protein